VYYGRWEASTLLLRCPAECTAQAYALCEQDNVPKMGKLLDEAVQIDPTSEYAVRSAAGDGAPSASPKGRGSTGLARSHRP
jgi:hypothetical protein